MAVELIPIHLEGDGLDRMKGHVKRRLSELQSTLKPLFETNLPNWRRAYEALPIEPVREFPFHNASNLVVPVIAIHTDTLLARIMAAIFKTAPIWFTRAPGKHNKDVDAMRAELENFLGEMAIEPEQLDLMRIYEQWIAAVICDGTSIIGSPWEKLTLFKPSGDGFGKYNGSMIPYVEYEGPRPEVVAFEDAWVPLGAKTLRSTDFFCRRRRMLQHEIESLKYTKYFDEKAVEDLLGKPDRTTPYITQQTAQQDLGASQSNSDGYKEWDIHECWFRYRDGDRVYKLLVHYHLGTNSYLRGVYDTYPVFPFVEGRLFYRKNCFHGYGFAEKLGQFQEEISLMHNQRRDAVTVSTMGVWRVDPDSTLHAGYKIYPSAMLPGKEGEIEPMKMGEPGPISIEEERLTLELADKLSGVAPPMQGSGAGFNTKRGVYSAMGTLSLLQEGNTRTDLNVADVRYAHTRLGRLFAIEYAAFDDKQSDRYKQFGESHDKIEKALDAILAGNISLPVRAANASVNREVEKQNDLMLSSIAMKHYGGIAQMMTELNSPMVSPQLKGYVTEAIQAANYMMQTVFKHFGYDEPERYIPDIESGGDGQPSDVGAQTPNAITQPAQSTGSPTASGIPQLGAGGGGPQSPIM